MARPTPTITITLRPRLAPTMIGDITTSIIIRMEAAIMIAAATASAAIIRATTPLRTIMRPARDRRRARKRTTTVIPMAPPRAPDAGPGKREWRRFRPTRIPLIRPRWTSTRGPIPPADGGTRRRSLLSSQRRDHDRHGPTQALPLARRRARDRIWHRRRTRGLRLERAGGDRPQSLLAGLDAA